MIFDAFKDTDEIQFLDQEYFLIKYKNKKLKYKYDDVIGLNFHTIGEKDHILKTSGLSKNEGFWIDIADDDAKEFHVEYLIKTSLKDYLWPSNYAHSIWPSISQDKRVLPYPYWYFRVRTFIPRLKGMFKNQGYKKYAKKKYNPSDTREWDGNITFSIYPDINPKARLIDDSYDLDEVEFNLSLEKEEISLTLKNTNRYTKKFPLLLGGKVGTINLENIDVIAEIFKRLGLSHPEFHTLCAENKLILEGNNPTNEKYAVPQSLFEYDENYRNELISKSGNVHKVYGRSAREKLAGFAEKAVDEGSLKIKEFAQKGTKECPFCAERVKEKAIKCKHCGSYI
tara:strand:- start:155 stop:1174 length:1020 start_codon:yes stop_codon:yes gene_type:complete